jgi:hypothetical protein
MSTLFCTTPQTVKVVESDFIAISILARHLPRIDLVMEEEEGGE